jgi:hypothetical protein
VHGVSIIFGTLIFHFKLDWPKHLYKGGVVGKEAPSSKFCQNENGIQMRMRMVDHEVLVGQEFLHLLLKASRDHTPTYRHKICCTLKRIGITSLLCYS